MPQPISFAHGNLVFGEGADDAWALFRLNMLPYAGLPEAARLDAQRRLAAVADALSADFSFCVWRVRGRSTTTCSASRRRLTSGIPAARLSRATWMPSGSGSRAGPPIRARSISRSGSLAGGESGGRAGTSISARRLSQLQGAAEGLSGQIGDLLGCAPAGDQELQWLVRRAYCRGLGDPAVDRNFKPQALAIDGPGESAPVRYRPLEVDLMRLFDAPITVGTAVCASSPSSGPATRHCCAWARCQAPSTTRRSTQSFCSHPSRQSTSRSMPRSPRAAPRTAPAA